MNDAVVIDSSVWIRIFRESVSEDLAKEVDLLIGERRAAIVPIINLEVLSGASTTQDFFNLKRSFHGLTWFMFDDKIWDISAKWAFELKRTGISVPIADILIAVTAYKNGALVLHADKHFDFISSKYPVETRNCLNLDAGKN
ncbi:MAG: PIN domain-containing protein [Candidatus Marinimicrobia bacterium]|nr:PIN domain-containing protein [Candidatus Neomarinimicrobiota bacterium]